MVEGKKIEQQSSLCDFYPLGEVFLAMETRQIDKNIAAATFDSFFMHS